MGDPGPHGDPSRGRQRDGGSLQGRRREVQVAVDAHVPGLDTAGAAQPAELLHRERGEGGLRGGGVRQPGAHPRCNGFRGVALRGRGKGDERQEGARGVDAVLGALPRSPASYKDALLPKGVPTMSVEAAVTMGWEEWADAFVGINVFGASAPGGTCMDKFGFNVANVVACAEKRLKGEKGVLSDGSQAKH